MNQKEIRHVIGTIVCGLTVTQSVEKVRAALTDVFWNFDVIVATKDQIISVANQSLKNEH